MTIQYSSSLRAVPIAQTLSHARSLAVRLGITRVTDITRLDRIGVPVYTSIRPSAKDGSLCVNAGKGFTPDEAKVGAYMEAIEFAFAEDLDNKNLNGCWATPADILDPHNPDDILDLCPILGVEIDLEERIWCIEAEELFSGQSLLVPAELVFLPFQQENLYFGTSSNGLASGNSVLEATVHGIAEVIERDIHSFQLVNDTSSIVNLDTLPEPLNQLVKKIRDAGLDLFVRYHPNEFNLPFFMAVIVDRLTNDPMYINSGYGCHTHRSIAATRAICEAVQSRLSYIHGGRDDLF